MTYKAKENETGEYNISYNEGQTSSSTLSLKISANKKDRFLSNKLNFERCPICQCEVSNLSKHLKIPHNSKASVKNDEFKASHTEKRIASAVAISSLSKKRTSPGIASESSSIWTISGGGGPGTGKKR